MLSETNADISRRRRMPSLSALRAFEAAARHGSFRAAADELNVTHSAISHQVKALEAYLGVPLFQRGGRAVRLTEEGMLLFPVLRDSFDSIVTGVDLLQRRQNTGPLTVQVYVTLAVRWLLPRLHGFSKAHPDIQVYLSTSYNDWDFDRGEVDVAILMVGNQHADLDYTLLGPARLFPVCAPGLRDGENGLKQLEDLRNHRLLDVYPAENDWPDWLQAAGLGDLAADPNTPRFDSYLLALEEAAAGQGVSLAMSVFVASDLQSGRLVTPFELSVESRTPWYYVCQKQRRNDPRIVKFRNWLIDVIQEERDASGFA